ncbi:MAG: DEAD/DEAH box helicase [Acidimicrobiia bacterium]|nr:DEAD/DEAH box helicase [Acidimicrobiia bacterium]
MTVTAEAVRARFVARQPFPLDRFQVDALDALDAGRSVLVAAPTGSGKTVVAEYAIDLALAGGGKAFYTTPIKALSNQKYADLRRRLGPGRVGLLTGDNAIDGDAPIVVMTTEVLRNMIYAGSPALDGLRHVVLDEVHYLQDHYRGPVWEEVIIHAPPRVGLVCLSATVSNAEEFADWITTVRGPCTAVIEEKRPVELVNLYLVGDKGSPDLHLLPTLVDGRPNPEAHRLDAETLRTPRPKGRPRRRFFTPNRLEVVDRLADDDLLPAIYFIFSRAACSDAMHNCLDAGVRLTTPDERDRIRHIVEDRTRGIADDDLRVLGHPRWLAALEAGVAAHHAGMVPPFKEAVEACFAEGLVKVVFATETLALGINMPARTVVIEKLSKYNGERHEVLTPGDYTQLTGRAGRRGIDPVGHAVVLWSPFVPFEQVAALASSRSFRLSSAFRPTYNMAANLVRRYDAGEAHHLLNLSFAQYQADGSVVSMEARLQKRQATLADLDAAAVCGRGSVEEYAALVRAEDDAGAALGPGRTWIAQALQRLRPGDVIDIEGPSGRAAVLSAAHRKGERDDGIRVKAVTARGKMVTLDADDFHDAPVAVAQVDLPEPYAPNTTKFQRAVAARINAVRVPRHHARGDEPDTSAVDAAADAMAAHPVHDCPDRKDHLVAAGRAGRLRREVAELKEAVQGRTESLARRFDRVLRLLEAWGYLDGWTLTERGETLGRLYHECDLLVAECLHEGVLDGLDRSAVAGLASAFGYEHRSPNPAPAPWFSSSTVRRRFSRMEELCQELHADEETAGLPLTRPPDAGFLAIAHAWAAGQGLEDVLEDEDVTAGDFVRVTKQLIDLLRQVGDIAPVPATAGTARDAAEALHRGVIAVSSALTSVSGGDDDPAAEVEVEREVADTE